MRSFQKTFWQKQAVAIEPMIRMVIATIEKIMISAV